MADLLALSSRIIDDNVLDVPNNRVTNELSEVADGLAVVESFSHSVVLDTGDGLVAFDASGVFTGGAVTEAIAGWSANPVTHLVYTHGHGDHVGGSGAFAERWGAPTVLGHANVNPRLARYERTSDWNVIVNSRQFGGIPKDLKLGIGSDGERWQKFLPDSVLPTDVAFADTHTFTVGDTTIELHHARGETDDHLWAWIPARRTIMAGDFLIWNFPNAGNPQKVQRYPGEWASALRRMLAQEPELFVPAHGLPIAGTDRIAHVLTTVADTLDTLVDEVVAMMNSGATLDDIVHTVKVPADTLALPYLRPYYNEPEFVVRNVWRQFGGWWDGAASRLKPAPDAELATELAGLAGGAGVLIERAEAAAAAANFRLAGHLADLAGWAAPDDRDVHTRRAAIYLARRDVEPSLMSKGIFAAAAKESQLVADADQAGG
ncbi:MAG TPA: alkyl sulfatase dimerization domain-containing protein [Ilumatobacter sp.]|nr:alkyl sulfatase dimerization domain-containing protein [Ilumatobacter sp.]